MDARRSTRTGTSTLGREASVPRGRRAHDEPRVTRPQPRGLRSHTTRPWQAHRRWRGGHGLVRRGALRRGA
ncbi:hypothetical protein HMPREF1980_01299 [Actinomyces sp. oral taxon 172 str. F0311]|nr:hypothetical protein HMPREF1980_01299 [Actinomyces sp. oral taxon 172 str. F0311]